MDKQVIRVVAISCYAGKCRSGPSQEKKPPGVRIEGPVIKMAPDNLVKPN